MLTNKFLGESPVSHLRQTISSKRKSFKKSAENMLPLGSSKNLCFDDIIELHKSGSELSDDIHSVSSNENDSSDVIWITLFFFMNIDQANKVVNWKEEYVKPKPFWKEALRQEERSVDKEMLKRLENRTRFLPNPRLDAARFAPL